METPRGYAGAILQVSDTEQAAQWLCENLFFTAKVTNGLWTLQNADCILYIVCGKSTAPEEIQSGYYNTGLVHVALATADIQKALEWCKSKGLQPELQEGNVFYNPGVFGKGEWYFNIQSPFGVTFEISQRIDHAGRQEEKIICGLDHLGIACADIEAEVDYLHFLGFTPLFETIHNFNYREGNILCVMVFDGTLTLEVYQFIDLKPHRPACSPLAGIWTDKQGGITPDGVHFKTKIVDDTRKEEEDGFFSSELFFTDALL